MSAPIFDITLLKYLLNEAGDAIYFFKKGLGWYVHVGFLSLVSGPSPLSFLTWCL